MSETNEQNYNPRIIESSMETVMHDAMMPYSEYVILERALPRVEDGLKPVQRRILYAMNELGNTPDKPYKKCARIVGECLGKYHPHGDTSVYDALVRLAQSFNMGTTLVEGQGNYGSADGDGAAAMRYTEARLAPIAMEMLADLDKDTVTFSSNFDDTLKEPDTLPGRFPNLLVNGATGIAIGLATNIPTHNITEVINGAVALIEAKIQRKKITLEKLMEYIPAPDFPTGGEIIPTEIVQAYTTGKGKITIRAKFHIEREGDKRNIVFTEFPYQVSKQEVLKKISDYKDEKKEPYTQINEVVDESDRNGIRAVIKLKKGADIADLIKIMFKQTALSKNFNFNMVAIADGKPRLMGLIEMLNYYVEYQRKVIKNRSMFELKKAQETEEILQGLLIAINNIDEVIRIIKKANGITDARSTLRVRFTLTERQANAILEMRLRRLTALEVNDLKQQIADIKVKIAELKAIVESEKRQYEVVIKELNTIKNKYRQPRRSTITTDAELCFTEVNELQNKVTQGVLVLRNNGTINYITNRSISQSSKDVSSFTFSSSVKDVVPATSDMVLYCFTDKGNYLRIYCDDLKESKLRDAGVSVKKLCRDASDSERIVKVFAVADEENETRTIATFTSSGAVRYTSLSEFNNVKVTYGQAIKLKDDSEYVVSVQEIEDKNVFLVSKKGKVVKTSGSDFIVKGRLTQGTGCMKVEDKDDCVIYAGFIDDYSDLLYITESGYVKRVFASEIPLVKNKPCKGERVFMNLCDLVYAGPVSDSDSIIVEYDDETTEKGKVEEVQIADIYDKGDALFAKAERTISNACVHKLSN